MKEGGRLIGAKPDRSWGCANGISRRFADVAELSPSSLLPPRPSSTRKSSKLGTMLCTADAVSVSGLLRNLTLRCRSCTLHAETPFYFLDVDGGSPISMTVI